MGKRFIILAVLVLPLHAVLSQQATAPESPEAERVRDGRQDGPERERRFQKLIDRMPPHMRQQMLENKERFDQLSPERREELRRQAAQRFQRIKEDFERAFNSQDLEALSPEQRESLKLNYFQKRRELEQRLRKEMQERRMRGVRQITKELSAEYNLPERPARQRPTSPRETQPPGQRPNRDNR